MSGTLSAKERRAMDQTAFGQVAGSFAAFHQEFAPLFGRTEAQRRSEQDVRGLLVQQTDRRNAENVAERIEEATPRTLAAAAHGSAVGDGASHCALAGLCRGAVEHALGRVRAGREWLS